jgi:hypothetical protein
LFPLHDRNFVREVRIRGTLATDGYNFQSALTFPFRRPPLILLVERTHCDVGGLLSWQFDNEHDDAGLPPYHRNE